MPPRPSRRAPPRLGVTHPTRPRWQRRLHSVSAKRSPATPALRLPATTRPARSTDGPFVESKEHLGGSYIIAAEDLDAALGRALRTTAIIGAPIEVRPFPSGMKAGPPPPRSGPARSQCSRRGWVPCGRTHHRPRRGGRRPAPASHPGDRGALAVCRGVHKPTDVLAEATPIPGGGADGFSRGRFHTGAGLECGSGRRSARTRAQGASPPLLRQHRGRGR